MSGSSIDSVENQFQKYLFSLQEDKCKETSKEFKQAENFAKFLLKDPENEFFQTDINTKLKNVLDLGSLLYERGRLPQSQCFYELSILISKKLLKTDPENIAYQSDVAMALNNFGILLWKMGYIEEAKQQYEKALEIRQKILDKYPKNVLYQSNVGETLNNLGNLFSDMGRIEDAKERYEKALDIRQKLLNENQQNTDYKSNVAKTLTNLGILLKSMGCIEDAKERYEKALEIHERLLNNDPKNVLYQSNVAKILNNLGILFKDMGCIEDAKDRYEKALKIHKKLLDNDPKNVVYQSNVGGTLNNLGNLLWMMGLTEDAREKCEKALEIYEKLLDKYPKNVLYQSNVGEILNNLGILLKDMGCIEDAKERYEKALEIHEKLLDNDPKNIVYQSDVGEILNNLGVLLWKMGCIKEAKQRFEKALQIYTEPMQYLTTNKKAESIIRLIEITAEQAEKETNSYFEIKYLEEAYHLCKKNQEFFSKYGLKHEKKLVMEAGLSAYVDYVIKIIRWERDSKKRAIGYEKAIKAIESLGKIEDDEEIVKVASSTVRYLEGRKLVNEALGSEEPNLELIKQAANEFKDAKETYKKANICYCIYIGLLKILENLETFEDKNGSKAKDLIQKIIEILPENIDVSIKAAFEEIAIIFDEKDVKSRKKHLEEFDGKIRAIEYKAVENLFGHVQRKLKDYIEEPFSPNLFYNNWKLKVTFDAERIKDKLLTVKIENIVIFNRVLSKEEIKSNSIEIDFLENKYIPSREEIIFFEIPNHKPVTRSIDYSETISKNKKSRIFLHNCCNSICSKGDLRVAIVQLKYDVYVENYIVKILKDESYRRKVLAILEAVKRETDIVVFPEFSIPFDLLEDIQRYSNENGIIVFAGTHYIAEDNLEKYEKLFVSNFIDEDLRKNICPIVIPNSKIVHNEKMFGAKEENDLFFHKGMKQGKLNHIFKLRENLNLGVLICFEYLNDELRNRLISACDIILVPQTNPNPLRFHITAKNDLNNPLCAGNKVCIMANGIFRIGKMENNHFVPEKKGIFGGSSGILLTLDKDSNKMLGEGIIPHKEQFVLLATINMRYSPLRYTQSAPEPVKTELIYIFEEKEILLTRKKSKGEFLSLIRKISTFTDRTELKNSIKNKKSLILEYSPLMYERTRVLNNLEFDEIKEKCRYILIPAE